LMDNFHTNETLEILGDDRFRLNYS
jgi:hypothetical protein